MDFPVECLVSCFIEVTTHALFVNRVYGHILGSQSENQMATWYSISPQASICHTPLHRSQSTMVSSEIKVWVIARRSALLSRAPPGVADGDTPKALEALFTNH